MPRAYVLIFCAINGAVGYVSPGNVYGFYVWIGLADSHCALYESMLLRRFISCIYFSKVEKDKYTPSRPLRSGFYVHVVFHIASHSASASRS